MRVLGFTRECLSLRQSTTAASRSFGILGPVHSTENGD